MDISFPDRAFSIRRGVSRLCGQLAWAVLHEVPLPNGRRADILALRPEGGFTCIEVKSGVRDFLADNKWPDYRAFCDHFYFAVDADFPQEFIPTEAGLVVAAGMDAEILRDAPLHAVPAARRRSLLHRFATLGATRLAALEDPGGFAALRSALRAE